MEKKITTFCKSDFPDIIYQTNVNKKTKEQNSSQWHRFKLNLCEEDFDLLKKKEFKFFEIFHFCLLIDDLFEYPLVRDEKTDKMVPFIFPKDNFETNLNKEDKTILVEMYRKCLPISIRFGNCKFVLSLFNKETKVHIYSPKFLVKSKTSYAKAREPSTKSRKPTSKVSRIIREDDYENEIVEAIMNKKNTFFKSMSKEKEIKTKKRKTITTQTDEIDKKDDNMDYYSEILIKNKGENITNIFVCDNKDIFFKKDLKSKEDMKEQIFINLEKINEEYYKERENECNKYMKDSLFLM